MCMFYSIIWSCRCCENITSPCGEYALRRFDPDLIFEMEQCPALWLNGVKNKSTKCHECLIKDYQGEQEKVREARNALWKAMEEGLTRANKHGRDVGKKKQGEKT